MATPISAKNPGNGQGPGRRRRSGARNILWRPFAAALRLLALIGLLATYPGLVGASAGEGGPRVGMRFVVVSSLGDKGPGTLRAALAQSGPRIVVFSVGGYISLASDLIIERGDVIVAGETAPDPGIIIRRGTVKVRTSDVELRHIAVYPGSSDDAEVASDRDGISVYGSPSRKNVIHDVVLSHVTVGWGVDENVSLQGLVDGVRIERSIMAEALRHGGHPKGAHSMNLLFANSARHAEILGNIFAVSDQRSPRLTNGNQVFMANNFIYGFGRASTHIDRSQEILNSGSIHVIGNVYKPTADSHCDQPIVQIAPTFAESQPPTEVALFDNIAIGNRISCVRKDGSSGASDEAWNGSPAPTDWRVVPAHDVYPMILDQAGARPLARNPIDARIVDGMREGTLRIIDSEADVGGWPDIQDTERAVALPIGTRTILTDADLAATADWLCGLQKQVGGSSAACD